MHARLDEANVGAVEIPSALASMVWPGLPCGVGSEPSVVDKLNARSADETIVAGSVELEPLLASSSDRGGVEKKKCYHIASVSS